MKAILKKLVLHQFSDRTISYWWYNLGHYTELKHPKFHWKPHSALALKASFRIYVHNGRWKRKDGSLIQQHGQLHWGFQIPSDPFSQESSAQPLKRAGAILNILFSKPIPKNIWNHLISGPRPCLPVRKRTKKFDPFNCGHLSMGDFLIIHPTIYVYQLQINCKWANKTIIPLPLIPVTRPDGGCWGELLHLSALPLCTTSHRLHQLKSESCL